LPQNIRIRVPLERASEATLVELRQMIAASPGPGKLMLNMEQKGQFCVMLEPMGVTVGADRGFIDRAEELLGRGMVQALD
jgi:DNA polymerase-3 subunit alpha